MNYTITKTHVIDENNNQASINYWGSEEKAKKSLTILKNCRNCTDCTDCTDCSYCTDCTDCSYCSYCTNCSNCSKQITGLLWTITYNSTDITIGCQKHTIEKWENFTDEEISKMEPRALNFWNKYKTIILSLVKQEAQ
jgi:hypothetical protein